MKALEYNPEQMEYYRNSDFPSANAGGPVEEVVGQPRTEVEGKAVEKDPMSREREQQLETWMTDIKAFIRSIDISKL